MTPRWLPYQNQTTEMRRLQARATLSFSVVVFLRIQSIACAEQEHEDTALPASQENATSPAGEPLRVDTKGVTASIAYEAPLGAGFLQALEGRMPDTTVTYGPGDYFFEAGTVSHRAENNTSEPNTPVLFEILPMGVAGPFLIPPRDGPVE